MDASFNNFALTNPAANDWQYQTFTYNSSANTLALSLEGPDADKVDFIYDTGNKTFSFRAKTGVVGPGGQATAQLGVKANEDGVVTSVSGTGQLMATNLFRTQATIQSMLGTIETDMNSNFEDTMATQIQNDGAFTLSNVATFRQNFAAKTPAGGFQASLGLSLSNAINTMPLSSNHSLDASALVNVQLSYTIPDQTWFKTGIELSQYLFNSQPGESQSLTWDVFAEFEVWQATGSLIPSMAGTQVTIKFDSANQGREAFGNNSVKVTIKIPTHR